MKMDMRIALRKLAKKSKLPPNFRLFSEGRLGVAGAESREAKKGVRDCRGDAQTRTAGGAEAVVSVKSEYVCQSCQEKEAEIKRLQSVIAELSLYFTSGNSVPVSQATIKSPDFWRIVGRPVA